MEDFNKLEIKEPFSNVILKKQYTKPHWRRTFKEDLMIKNDPINEENEEEEGDYGEVEKKTPVKGKGDDMEPYQSKIQEVQRKVRIKVVKKIKIKKKNNMKNNKN